MNPLTFFKRAPINGHAGLERGYDNTIRMLERAGTDSKEAQDWWKNAEGSDDDYDKGVVKALRDKDVPDPFERMPEG